MNHNKDKTNISHTSHVSFWGFSAFLCTAFMMGSHLLLFPLSLKWNKPFVCSLEQNLQVRATTQKHLLVDLVQINTLLKEHLDVNCHKEQAQNWLFSSLSGYITVFELWFWWKTPESEDSLISHIPNKGVRITLCHYWKRKVWATRKTEGWFTFLIYICYFLILHSLLQRVSLPDFLCLITISS